MSSQQKNESNRWQSFNSPLFAKPITSSTSGRRILTIPHDWFNKELESDADTERKKPLKSNSQGLLSHLRWDFIASNRDHMMQYALGVSKKELEEDLAYFQAERISQIRTKNADNDKSRVEKESSFINSIVAITGAHEDSSESQRFSEKYGEKIKGAGADFYYKRFEQLAAILEEAALHTGLYPVFVKDPTRGRNGSHGLRLLFEQGPILVNATGNPIVYLIEEYNLTTIRAQTTAGPIVHTMALLPGEETELTVKTWKEDEISRSRAESVFDSQSEESQRTFSREVQGEQSIRTQDSRSRSLQVGMKASASWGWGSVSGSVDHQQSNESQRSEFTKNVMTAAEKHAQRSNSERKLTIESSISRKQSESEERSIQRFIRNPNLSRTLNFIFRQVVEDYESFLHLVGIRFFYFDGTSRSREFDLLELYDLIQEMTDSSDIELVRRIAQRIGEHLCQIYGGRPISQESRPLRDDNPKMQTNCTEGILTTTGDRKPLLEYPADNEERKDLVRHIETNGPPCTSRGWNKVIVDGKEFYLQGIDTAQRRFTLYTDGMVAESHLGQSDALDSFITNMRKELLGKNKLDNKIREQLIAASRQLLKKGDHESLKYVVKAVSEFLRDSDGEKPEEEEDSEDGTH
ncbi:MAG: hypothetical protein DWQ01_11015 [Planctomycetota bacterium]|nr:MAG: hypothetical protein DWQ01_11015 [Planctomycetota bacterium]